MQLLAVRTDVHTWAQAALRDLDAALGRAGATLLTLPWPYAYGRTASTSRGSRSGGSRDWQAGAAAAPAAERACMVSDSTIGWWGDAGRTGRRVRRASARLLRDAVNGSGYLALRPRRLDFASRVDAFLAREEGGSAPVLVLVGG